MTMVTRRKLLHSGTVSIVSGILCPSTKLVTFEERLQLTNAVGNTIFVGWNLFHTTNVKQTYSLGQSQLSLLQQAYPYLHPHIIPSYYSAVYRLIGATLYMQGHYHEAYNFQKKAYSAALEENDVWNMAQTLSWQAYGWMALGRYKDTLAATEAALQLISRQDDIEHVRLRTRLLAFGAESATFGGSVKDSNRMLDISQGLLEWLPRPHEEFDRASWHHYAGVCNMHQQKFDAAIAHFQQSLQELPPSWALRYGNTLLSLARAYARRKERDESISIARKVVPIICLINTTDLCKQLMDYIREDLFTMFPGDDKVRNFVAATRHQLFKSTFTQKD